MTAQSRRGGSNRDGLKPSQIYQKMKKKKNINSIIVNYLGRHKSSTEVLTLEQHKRPGWFFQVYFKLLLQVGGSTGGGESLLL